MTSTAFNKTGDLPTTTAASYQTLYRVPDGKKAVIANITYHNSAGAARNATLAVQAKGDTSPTAVATPALTAVFSAGDDWSTSEERWVLAAGTALLGFASAGGVGYFISGLEMDA